MPRMWTHTALLIAHVLAAVFWVGGMATLHFAVRPAVAACLPEPTQRLALMGALLRRFFLGVVVAILVLLLSGLAMVLLGGGFAVQPVRVHTMFALGLVMMALFGQIRFALYPRLQAALAVADTRTAAATMNRIRQLVGVNLVLGVSVVAIALLGRASP